MRTEAVTTFTKAGYDLHAKNLLSTWTWTPLHCYEQPLLDVCSDLNVFEYDFETECPEYPDFKQEFGHMNGQINGKYNYLLDAVKWSHRIFALAAQARKSEADILINVDADIVVFEQPPWNFAEQLLGDADIAYMPRGRVYSECSFVVYRLTDLVREFIAEHEKCYTLGTIFAIREGLTDCHAFDALVGIYKKRGLKVVDINDGIPWSMHPFVNGPLGKYMDHLKGARKHDGKSHDRDFVVKRSEDYWKEVVTNGNQTA